VFLPIDYFDIFIGHYNIRARLFNKTLNVSQDLINMLTTIADATHAKFSDLPMVLFVYFRNRYIKLLACPGHDRLKYLAFIF